MTAVLIDDEKNNIDNLRQLLNIYCPQVIISGTAADADEGKRIILKQQPMLVFLDIQMPCKNGFDMLKELDAYHFDVVFVTAHDQYAIQALRFAAVDYLLKPIDINELQFAVSRVFKRQLQKEHNRQIENLMDLLKSQKDKDDQRIALTTLKETRFVRTGDIVRCESSNNYSTIYLLDGEQLLVCRPIYEFEEILNSYGFIRCHQSHLVNRKFIKSWKKEYGDFFLMTNGNEVPISRNKKEMVKKTLGEK